MNLRNNSYTPFLLMLHGLLSVSSFIFHVPLNRHKGLPMIYKEFRLHSIIFALRSVVCALSFYYKFSLVANVFFINLTMLCAISNQIIRSRNKDYERDALWKRYRGER